MLLNLNSFLAPSDNKFPFFNLYTLTSTNSYVIEVAVAGYTKAELVIQQSGEYLSVKGVKTLNSDDKCFLVKGISQKSFSKNFFIGARKVKTVKLANGILSISLEDVSAIKESPIEIED